MTLKKTRRPSRRPVAPDGTVRKGVCFTIDALVWEKFKLIAGREAKSVADLIVEVVEGECSKIFTPLDAEVGAEFPHLIGAGVVEARTPPGRPLLRPVDS